MRAPAVVIPLAGRLEVWFPPATRERGLACVREKRLSVHSVSAVRVAGWVRATGMYNVAIEAGAATLAVRCSCAVFTEQDEYCEHIWALILHADASAALVMPKGKLSLAELEEDKLPPPTRRSRKAPPAAPPPPPLPPIVWRALAAKHAAPVDPRTLAPLRREHRREARCVVKLAASSEASMLVIAFEQRSITPRGYAREWHSVSLRQAEASSAPEDTPALELLAGCRAVSTMYSEPSSVAVPLPLAVSVCALLMRGGRALVEPWSSPRFPLAVDTGGPWRFVLDVREDGADLVVHGAFARGAERIDLLRSWLVFANDVAILNDRILAIERVVGFDWCAAIRSRGAPVRIPAADRDDFLAFVAARGFADLPESLRLAESGDPPVFIARFAKPDVATARVRALAFASYGEREVLLGAPGHTLPEVTAKRVHVRNALLEREAIERIASLGARSTPDDGGVDLPIAKLSAATRSLLEWGWRVEGAGRRYRPATSTRAAIQSGLDWFELRADIDFEGESVALPRLLAAARRGESFIELGDGSLGVLPEEWLLRWGALAELGTARGEDAVRFARTQATLLDALVATVPDPALDESFTKLRERLAAGFRSDQEPTIPPEFVGSLRDYQRAGVAWMEMLADAGFGGCLADDMGLGKTVQVLARLAARRGNGPSLVVAPRSLLFNWKDEAARFVPSLRVLEHSGTSRRVSAERFAAFDLVLTTYGTLRRDAEALAAIDFDYAILDEAQAVKNDGSEAAKAVRGLRARHRLALSGTPIENHLGELWSLFEFLNPRMLGRSTAFKRWSSTRALDEEDRALLARALRPFLLRRTKGEVARELPERVEQTIECVLGTEQRALYDELRRHYRRSLLARAKKSPSEPFAMNVLEALLRLRQAACHPALIDPAHAEASSAKVDSLFAQLTSVLEEGHKAIIFSQFTSLLALVSTRLRAQNVDYESLDGSTRNREACVQRFQEDPDCQVFLVSLKAGGAGLNLTAATYVFILDPWWNPAAEAQAIDRAHRIGQTKTVFAYKLVAKDTIEERVLALQASKRELAEGILGPAAWSVMRELKVEDLDLLLS